MEVVGIDSCILSSWRDELIEISVIGKNISIPVNVILDLIYYDDGDLVFLSGSLIEGIGNVLSDLDVYVIKKRELPFSSAMQDAHDAVRLFSNEDASSGKSIATYDYVTEYVLNVEVEYWTFADVSRLLSEVNRKSSASSFFGLSPNLELPSFKASRLVHNIVTATPLTGHEKLADLVNSFHLPSYCFMRFNSLAGSYEDFKDLAGVFISGDYLRAYDLAREFVTVQMHALTHLHLNTNFRRKWLLTYLQKLPRDYDLLVARYTHLVYESVPTSSLRSKFLELVSFLGKIFSAFGSTLNSSPAFSSVIELLSFSEDINRVTKNEETQRVIDFRKLVVGNEGFDSRKWLAKDYWC
ncbi:hypothetical protein ACTABT_15630 [Pseudomonas syringae]|uniref:hypothetical protein n=1 Tax=Pseudomonas syringae TaxID=317 RepID=UPI003F756E79